MPPTVRTVLIVQVALFAAASLLHQGFLLPGYEDSAAATAEGIIAIALFAGLVIAWLDPVRARVWPIVAQLFALAGTSIGVFLLIRGVAPSTPLDVAIHALMVVLLVAGLWLAWKAAPATATTA
jgi:hypothetical protein